MFSKNKHNIEKNSFFLRKINNKKNLKKKKTSLKEVQEKKNFLISLHPPPLLLQ